MNNLTNSKGKQTFLLELVINLLIEYKLQSSPITDKNNTIYMSSSENNICKNIICL